MNRLELLGMLLRQAQLNGFEFRHWFHSHIRQEWPGYDQALALVATEGRYYALLFSHDFARCFWRTGSAISFRVPSTTYQRINNKGQVVEVQRKPFTRRSVKADVWKYHLRCMAEAENPVAYLCRFLPVSDQDRLDCALAAKRAGELGTKAWEEQPLG